MKQLVAIGALGMGGVLLVASFVWPALFNSTASLSEEDYARLEELEDRVVELHLQMESIKRRTGSDAKPEEASLGFKKIVEERDELRTKLESGIKRPEYVASTLRYVGLGLAGIGVVVHLATKSS